MFIYFVISLIVIALGLVFFYTWIDKYEKSRATYAINQYIENLNEDDVSKISANLLSELNTSIVSNEDCCDAVYNMIKSSTPAKDVAASSSDTQVYYLENGDGIYVEKVTLSPGEEGLYGFIPWKVSGEEILSENLVKSSQIRVADTWTVKFKGETLSKDNIVDSSTKYSLLDGFYDEGYDLPVMVTYSTGGYIGKAELIAVSPDGTEVADDLLTEEYFSDNCTESEKQRLELFCKDYITRYVSYTSRGTQTGSANYSYLMEIIDPQSKLYTQVQSSLQGFGYASSKGDVITDIRVKDYMNIGSNSYVCRVEYDLETYGSHNSVTDQTYSIRLMAKDVDGKLLAEAYLNY